MRRQDQHAGVGRGLAHLQPGLRRDAQPVGHDALGGRLERRRRRRAGLPHAADRRRQRPRRLAAQPGGLERRARPAPDARPRPALARRRRRGCRSPSRARWRARPAISRSCSARMAGPRSRATRSRSAPRSSTSPRRSRPTCAAGAWPGARRVGGLPIEPRRARLRWRPRSRCSARSGLDVSEDEPDLSGADEVFETWRAFLSATGLGDEYDARGDAMKATVRAEVERGRALTSADAQPRDAACRPSSPSACGRSSSATTTSRARSRRSSRSRSSRSTRPRSTACAMGSLHRVDALQLAHQRDAAARPSRCPSASAAAGLPVGLQLVARPFGERALLEVAHALERAPASAERLPPLAA